MYKTKTIQTNDGIQLNVIDEGTGKPIILLHGWSQTAELFRYQIDALKKNYRVIAYDMRGHGDSEKPEFGHRISRLAKDLDDLINALNLKNVILLGHSMGCSVIWCYIDLFGEDNVSKFIFVDQQAFMAINPAWSEDEKLKAGASVPQEHIFAAVNAFGGENGEEISKKFLASRLTPQTDENTLNWVIEQNLKMPRKLAGTLFLNHMMNDWSDVIPRIKTKTLIITGKASDKTPESQNWIKDSIPGSELVVFEKEERGSHFMFLENPDKFNQVVMEFIGEYQ